MLRILYAILSAGAISFSLFALMSAMLPKEKDSLSESESPFSVEMVVVENELSLQKAREPKKLPEPNNAMALPMTIIDTPEVNDSAPKLTGPVSMPNVSLALELAEVNPAPYFTTPAQPIVRILPRYPVNAALEGVEGWVKLSFSISPTGGVEDIAIIESYPTDIFNESALKALSQWQYKAQIEDGIAVHQHHLMVQLHFNL